jgi:hypothetical protein
MGPHTTTFSGWLTKVKSDGAKARWISGSNKRYFTINFETQTFYYGHDETNKKTNKGVANPIDFFDIMHAEQLPQMSSEGRRSLQILNRNQEMEFGFIVRTRDREIRLFSASWKESRRWVDSLNAAGRLGQTQKGLPSGGLRVENSHSQASLSTNEGSGSGSSPPSDDGSDGAAAWQPISTWDKPASGGYANAKAPWKPAPAGAPPVWAQVGQPYTGGSLPPWAPGPDAGSKANADLEFVSGVDAFAALDALADELGPLPEANVSPKKERKKEKITPKFCLKNARDIAALKNPEMAPSMPPVATSIPPRPQPPQDSAASKHPAVQASKPEVVPPPPSSLAQLPSLAPVPAFFQEAEDIGASTPSKRTPQAPQGFPSALGTLPGPQQFMISDSPEKDDDAHSWDDDMKTAEDEMAIADVIAFATESRGEGAFQDNDPWDSEPDEPSEGKLKQKGPSEGQGVDHHSWDSEDEGETKNVKRQGKSLKKMKGIPMSTEDSSLQDLDELVGEVLDGQKRVPVHEHLPDFRCTQCDHGVICFAGFKWASEVDYLFVRNFHGKPEKLRPKLSLSPGNTAYCCQCSWKTAASTETLKAVGSGLRWRSIS